MYRVCSSPVHGAFFSTALGPPAITAQIFDQNLTTRPNLLARISGQQFKLGTVQRLCSCDKRRGRVREQVRGLGMCGQTLGHVNETRGVTHRAGSAR